MEPTALNEQLSSWPAQARVPRSVCPPPDLPVGEGGGRGGGGQEREEGEKIKQQRGRGG